MSVTLTSSYRDAAARDPRGRGPWWWRLADVLEHVEQQYGPGYEFTVAALRAELGGSPGELTGKLKVLRSQMLLGYTDGSWWLEYE